MSARVSGVARLMAGVGFKLEHTGGNCTAYTRRGRGWERYVTSSRNHVAPTRPTDPVTLTHYRMRADGNGQDATWEREFPSVTALVRYQRAHTGARTPADEGWNRIE